MRLDALYSLTRVGPDLDLAILAAGVAPALFVEAEATEHSGGVCASHDSWLLQALGHVGRMPESDLLRRDRGKAKIIGALGPGHVNNSVGRAVGGHEGLLPFDVVDTHAVVV